MRLFRIFKKFIRIRVAFYVILSWIYFVQSWGKGVGQSPPPPLPHPKHMVTSPTNSTSRRSFSNILLYFIFIFHLPRCTIADFPLYIARLPCHFDGVVIEQQHISLTVVDYLLEYIPHGRGMPQYQSRYFRAVTLARYVQKHVLIYFQ